MLIRRLLQQQHSHVLLPLALRYSSSMVHGTWVKKKKTLGWSVKVLPNLRLQPHRGGGVGEAVVAGWRPDRKVDEAIWNKTSGFKSELGRSSGRLPYCVPRRRSKTVTGRGRVMGPSEERIGEEDGGCLLMHAFSEAGWQTYLWSISVCVDWIHA